MALSTRPRSRMLAHLLLPDTCAALKEETEQLPGILGTIGAVFGNRRKDDVVHGFAERRDHHVGIGEPPHRQLAGQHAVHHPTDRIHICAGVDMLGALSLFRRHVVAAAHAEMRDRTVLAIRRFGNTEVR